VVGVSPNHLAFETEISMKTFLAAGDILLNPDLLAYAVIETDSEGQRVRLGFTGLAGAAPSEMLLTGFEARSVLRWLRTNAEFLDAGGPSFHGHEPRGPVIGWKTDDAQRSGRARDKVPEAAIR
jgi:hypothetical protein